MKKVIAAFILAASIVIGIYSKIGDLITAVEVSEAVKPAFRGDYVNATSNVANLGAYLIVDAVYIAVYGVIIATVIGFFLTMVARLR